MKKILCKVLSWTLTILTIAFFCVISCLVVGFTLDDLPITTITLGLLILTLEIADLFIRAFVWAVEKLIKRRFKMSDFLRWEKQNDNTYYLHFIPYEEEQHLATLKIGDDGFMAWDCPDLGIDSEIVWADDISGAKDEIISSIEELYQDQKNYYTELCEKFKEV